MTVGDLFKKWFVIKMIPGWWVVQYIGTGRLYYNCMN
jgi:hypothetical protein